MDFEARGTKVVPVFAGGLDFSGPVNKYFYDPLNKEASFVDTVVSLTGFALVGGPARQDAPKAVTALSKLGVPYLCSLPLVFQTTNEWLDSELGVHPVQVALQVRTAFCCNVHRTKAHVRVLLRCKRLMQASMHVLQHVATC